MRTSIIISILISTLLLIQAVNQNIFSYVPGRSGDILLKPRHYEDNSFVFLLNRYASELNEISDQSFADLISHQLGGPIINSEISRDGFPKGSVFDKSNANLMFVVDSIDTEFLSKFEDLKLFKLKNQPNELSGKRVNLIKSTYPQDTIATLASISSGSTPSTHGITGSSWATQFGQIDAFRAGALPFVQNVVDLFSQNFGGKSLVLSASSNFQMSSALAVNQFSHSILNNNVGLYYNQDHGRYESIYVNGIDASILRNTYRELVNALAQSPFPLPGAQDTMTYSSETNSIRVNLISKDLDATFSVLRNDVFMFFAELQFVRNLITVLRSEPAFISMTTDKVPDLFSFSYASLKELEKKYGQDSAQYKIAMYLLDEIMVEAIQQLSIIYENKLSVEVVFLTESAVDNMKNNENEKSKILYKLGNKVRADVFENNYPSIYLKNTEIDQNDICNELKSTTLYDVYCADPSDYEFSSYSRQVINNGTVVGTKDAAVYQICLWFSIVIGLALIATVIAFCCMDVGADSMIYRSTNLKHMHIS